MSIVIEQVKAPTDEACMLIEELDAELSGSFTAEQRHGLSVARVFQPGVAFFLARLDGEPIGCGGVAFADGLAEVKRMYVRPPARGRGVARAILARLEAEVRARGVGRLVLETGDVLHAAIRFTNARASDAARRSAPTRRCRRARSSGACSSRSGSPDSGWKAIK